jgi:hypothetical protein
MTGSINPKPTAGMAGIGLEYSLLYWIGRLWRSSPLYPEPITMEPEAALALMVWADEGGADERA